jgi:hypothetical protein
MAANRAEAAIPAGTVTPAAAPAAMPDEAGQDKNEPDEDEPDEGEPDEIGPAGVPGSW